MRKFYAVLAACLLLGALGNPVAAQRTNSTEQPNTPDSTQLDRPELGHRSPPSPLIQSRFDSGNRQVVNGAAYCTPIKQDRARDIAREREALSRAAERQDLEVLLAVTSSDNRSSMATRGRSKARISLTPTLEFPTTWQSSHVVQHVLREVSSLVEAHADLYGYEIDDRSEAIVVVHRRGADLASLATVIDRLMASAEASIAAENEVVAMSDLSDLSAEERAAVKQDMAELNRMSLADVDLTVEFRPVCRASVGDLDEVQAAVESFDWTKGPSAPGSIDADSLGDFEIAVQRNLVDGVIQVVVESEGEQSAEIERLLRQEFGADVEVVVDPEHGRFGTPNVTSKSNVPGRTLQAGRYADKSPHLGGVQFGDWGFGRGACTSGFAINMANGGRAMLTAGHCKDVLPIDTYVYSGVFGRRATHNYYGVFYESYWYDRDIGLIGSGIEKYRRKIYTDPDPSGANERLVTGTWEAWLGAEVCMSGSFTGNICGGKVTGSYSACARDNDVDHCGHSYDVERRDGKAMSQPGDSGGPVYLPHGSTSARALGIITQGLGSRSSFIGSEAIYKATGGWIASSCCDADTW